MAGFGGGGGGGGGVTLQATVDRIAAQPAAGALVYDTDLSLLFVGDGATWGGYLAGKAQPLTTVNRGVAMPGIGELVLDTDLGTLWVGDGATMGGVAVGGSSGGGGDSITLHALTTATAPSLTAPANIPFDIQSPAGGLVIAAGAITIPAGTKALLTGAVAVQFQADYAWFEDGVEVGSKATAYPPAAAVTSMGANTAATFVDATGGAKSLELRLTAGGGNTFAGLSYATVNVVTPGGGGTLLSDPWDWAQGLAPPALTDWTDAKTIDAVVGNSPSVYDSILGGKALRFVPGVANFGGGIVRAVAGDFVWAFRLGIQAAHFGQLDNSTMVSMVVNAIYTDAGGAGTTLTKPSYGGGVWLSSTSWEAHQFGSFSLSGGFASTTLSVAAIDRFTWARATTIDLWLEYVSASSTLTVWGAPKGEAPIKLGEQVIAGAVHSGYVGINVIQGASTDVANRVLLFAAASVGSVPGFE